jgi:hypothetical protein
MHPLQSRARFAPSRSRTAFLGRFSNRSGGMRLAMSEGMSASISHRIASGTPSEPSSRTSPIVRQRIAISGALTAFAVVAAVGVGLALGPTFLLMSGLTLPAPLVLLWLSSDVLRSDEKRVVR